MTTEDNTNLHEVLLKFMHAINVDQKSTLTVIDEYGWREPIVSYLQTVAILSQGNQIKIRRLGIL